MAESGGYGRSASARGVRRHNLPSVCVVGVGTVGLHDALAFDEVGHDTVGYDVDGDRIRAYRRGTDPSGAVADDRLARSDCAFTTDPTPVETADYVLVAVPTATDGGDPSVAPVVAAAETVGRHLSPDTTVVVVSTVYPGATEEAVVPALESASGMAAGADFHVAHAPARLSVRTDGSTVVPATRLVGADSSAVAEEVAAQFDRVVDAVHVLDGIPETEAAKCVENAQRDVNIALTNELARLLGGMGLDARAVLDAAGTKWNFRRYDPGLVGGECVPVAPWFLIERSRRAGGTPRLLRLAREVNEQMVDRVVDTTVAALDRRAGRLHRTDGTAPADPPTVLLLGLSYKPDSNDLGATPSEAVARRLEGRDVRVVGHDPLVDADAAADALGIEVVGGIDDVSADGVAVLVGHEAFASLTVADVLDGAASLPVVVDLPGVFDPRSDDAPIIYRDVSDVS